MTRRQGMPLWRFAMFRRLVLLLTAVAEMTTTTTHAFSSTSPPPVQHFIGIDLGTSGCRISVLQQHHQQDDTAHPQEEEEVYTKAVLWKDGSYNDPASWVDAVRTLIKDAASTVTSLDTTLQSICISGTSASCVLMDTSTGQSTRGAACMYDYSVTDQTVLEQLAAAAPLKHTATSPTAPLAKLLEWHAAEPVGPNEMLAHQADYVVAHLLERNNDNDNNFQVVSDWHNCLKAGYDVRTLAWPQWLVDHLQAIGVEAKCVLPQTVASPGQVVGQVNGAVAADLGICPHAKLVGGTTDSNAAFIAAVAGTPTLGTAVTSLGSTLAMKLLSPVHVEDSTFGVYSHRFPNALLGQDNGSANDDEIWLVGGASNTGCAIFRQLEFSNDELAQLSSQINPLDRSPLQYYPLTKTGERFPVADPNKQAVLEPRPESRVEFLHGLLESITAVEVQGFDRLHTMGAPWPTQVWTAGGGARNDVWIQMRQDRLARHIGEAILVAAAPNTEASYGAALLAAASFVSSSKPSSTTSAAAGTKT